MPVGPHRPLIHFTAPRGWMNDPNGLIRHDGRVHLFYQHNPLKPEWGRPHWGHAVSDDLVDWRHRPIALEPGATGPDKDGCFSGCCACVGGEPTFFYTGVYPQVQCVARPAPGCGASLDRFILDPGEPLLAEVPPECEGDNFRDPFVWRESTGWHMLLGAQLGARGIGMERGRGAILHYRCDSTADPRHRGAWRYTGVFFGNVDATEGYISECPNFVRFARPAADGTNAALLFKSFPHDATVYWRTGVWDGERFEPRHRGRLDAGTDLYATLTFDDPAREGGATRHLMFAWMNEAGLAATREGWAGAMALPRELLLLPDATLGQRPVAELERLREAAVPAAELLADPIACRSPLELLVEAEPGEDVELHLRMTPGARQKIPWGAEGGEFTRLLVSRNSRTLLVDRRFSSADAAAKRDVIIRPLPLADGDPLRLRVFVDRSTIELFANDRVAAAIRVYPTRDDSESVALKAGVALGGRLTAWRLRPARFDPVG